MRCEFDPNELHGMFSALSNGSLSPEDLARLELILSQSAEARRLWFLHCDIEIGLADWAAFRDAKRKLTPKATAHLPRKSRAWFWGAALAAASIVVAVLLLRPPAHEEQASTGVAVLSRTVEVQWANGSKNYPAGAVLPADTLRLKSGAVLIEFYSGARAIVEGPADFKLDSANSGFLRAGKISAHVPPQARGFKIESPGLTVVDQGTDFGFAVKGDASAEVHVFEGTVEVAPAGHSKQTLKGGQAVHLDAGELKAIPAEHTAYLSESELFRRDATGANTRFGAWRDAARVLDADPSCVIHYRFEELGSTERILKNSIAAAAQETQGSIVGCEWVDGRWPNKRALRFRGESDRVRLIAAKPMNTVTFLAWVRISALPHGVQTLLAADAEQTGALRWELSQTGRLRLSVGRDLGHSHLDWEVVESEQFVTADRMGQWIMLVTTFDGSTIRHYGNGRPIGTGASFRPPALLIGSANVGNWQGPVLRHLSADMDEFAILSRVMKDEEILALFESGQP